MLRIGFYQLEELASFGLPLAERTLRNKIRDGAIRLGSGQPDLPIRHVGGRVVVAAADLQNWLRAMGGLPAAETTSTATTAAEPADPATRRRPGRPRQSAGAGQ